MKSLRNFVAKDSSLCEDMQIQSLKIARKHIVVQHYKFFVLRFENEKLQNYNSIIQFLLRQRKLRNVLWSLTNVRQSYAKFSCKLLIVLN